MHDKQNRKAPKVENSVVEVFVCITSSFVKEVDGAGGRTPRPRWGTHRKGNSDSMTRGTTRNLSERNTKSKSIFCPQFMKKTDALAGKTFEFDWKNRKGYLLPVNSMVPQLFAQLPLWEHSKDSNR